MSQLPLYSSTVQMTSAANANAVAQRDSSGNINFAQVVATILSASQGVKIAYATKTTTYSITGTDAVLFICDATSAAFTITLPAVAGVGNQVFIILKKDSSGNAVTVSTAGAEDIIVTGTAATTYSLSARGTCLVVISDTVNWYGWKS